MLIGYLQYIFYLLSSATSAMASTNPMYTPWDSIPYITDLVKIQAIVTYCASQFRVSAAAFMNVEEREKREFFFITSVLSWYGFLFFVVFYGISDGKTV